MPDITPQDQSLVYRGNASRNEHGQDLAEHLPLYPKMEDEGNRIEEVKCAKASDVGIPGQNANSLTSPLPPTLASITPEPTSDEVFSTYSRSQRRLIVLSASFAGFFSPLATNIYLPALNSIAADLDVSPSLINLTVTTYLVS